MAHQGSSPGEVCAHLILAPGLDHTLWTLPVMPHPLRDARTVGPALGLPCLRPRLSFRSPPPAPAACIPVF